MVFDDEYDYCWLIDIGDYEKVEEELPLNMSIKGVFLTHAHFDHAYGINKLHKNHPGCLVYTSEYGKEALSDERKNFSRYHEAPFTYQEPSVIILVDTEEVEIFPNIRIKAYSTPGHCPSCLTYVVGDWIFTGDSYIPGVKVVSKLPKGNKIQAQQSVEKILVLAMGKIICPGHGEIVREVYEANEYKLSKENSSSKFR
jgi:hydroxyacylglutathione hydrolase